MIKNFTDVELKNCLRDEMATLKEYEKMFDSLSQEEKHELREWMADGNSVNSNPHLIYGETGRPMDFIAAARIAGEMTAHPEDFR